MDDDRFVFGTRDELGARLRQFERDQFAGQMFDPPLEGSLICGSPLCMIPDSDIKYKSFLEWWFAVGRKAPHVTTDGWGIMSGPHATRGKSEIIPKEDWESLQESEREAIGAWASKIPIAMFYD